MRRFFDKVRQARAKVIIGCNALSARLTVVNKPGTAPSCRVLAVLDQSPVGDSLAIRRYSVTRDTPRILAALVTL